MNEEEIIKYIFEHEKIVIIGYPDSGKTVLFKEIIGKPEAEDHFVFQTDSYKGVYEYKEQLYRIIDLLKDKKKYIIEGIMGCRFLRKLTQENLEDMKPDLIIICETNRKPQEKHLSMRKGLDKIWNDYSELERNKPKIIRYEN